MNFAKFLKTPFFTEHLWATASEGFTEIVNDTKLVIIFVEGSIKDVSQNLTYNYALR